MFFSRSMLGIDIGSSSIKLIELSGATDKKLKNFGMELLPHQAIIDGNIQDFPSVEESLKKLLRKLKIRARGRRAAISVSGSSVIIKKVNFPRQDPGELAITIENEAEQHLQFNLDDLYYTWHIYEPDGDSPDQAVLLVAVKREIIDQHIAVIKAAGLKVGVVDCDVFSLSNAFEENFGISENIVAIANVGASSTQVLIIRAGKNIFSREISIGGDNYNRDISAQLGLSWEQAESLKIDSSLGIANAPSEMRSIIARINKQLASEIQLSIDFFFQSENIDRLIVPISNLFLCGGGSKVFDLPQTLQGSLGIPVVYTNPFSSLEIPGSLRSDDLDNQSHLFNVAFGLSLRTIDDHLR